ncbi:MAG: DUF1232 domain-containing protein [Saprospiraceae bacterium]|nr:DUF1232 domain-containing protein [Saprospiraceae bacterium]
MRRPTDILKEWKNHLNESQFLGKVGGGFRLIGMQTVYAALLMFFAYKRTDTPTWAKRIILGALAYLLAPVDLLPDLSPFFGFTDDLGVLLFGLVSIAAYINKDIREKARAQLGQWFGTIDMEQLSAVDRHL